MSLDSSELINKIWKTFFFEHFHDFSSYRSLANGPLGDPANVPVWELTCLFGVAELSPRISPS